MKTNDIDWSAFTWPEDTCECRCGSSFRSHVKFVRDIGMISRRPCPSCGSCNNLRAARSEPETYTIGKP